MCIASGPAGLVACTSIVGTPFMGYTPTRAVPPQSMTAQAILSNLTVDLNASNASPPVSSAIFCATGWMPPPVMQAMIGLSSLGEIVSGPPQPPGPAETLTLLYSLMCSLPGT
jgi:hypothetical protein